MTRGTWETQRETVPFSSTGLSPCVACCSKTIRLTDSFVTLRKVRRPSCRFPRPPRHNADGLSHDAGLGCSQFARRYYGNRCCFLFLRILRCFNSPGWLHTAYVFSGRYPGMTPDGLSHSEICGSKVVCTSPQLIAAYHVLHRLRVPRHPPLALYNLTEKQ